MRPGGVQHRQQGRGRALALQHRRVEEGGDGIALGVLEGEQAPAPFGDAVGIGEDSHRERRAVLVSGRDGMGAPCRPVVPVEPEQGPGSRDAEYHESGCYGAGDGAEVVLSFSFIPKQENSMSVADHLSQSRIVFEEGSTLIAMIDMSLLSWVVLGLVPSLERRPEKKLGADEAGLLSLLHRCQDETERRGCRIERMCVAFESGRDGHLARSLARGLRDRGACDPRQQHSGEAGAASSQDRPPGIAGF